MSRRARLSLLGSLWHIIQRGNNRGVRLFTEEDYRFYPDQFGELARRFGCTIYAYVLMTNHVHLLLTPQRAASAGLLMKRLGRRYVQYINMIYRRTAPCRTAAASPP